MPRAPLLPVAMTHEEIAAEFARRGEPITPQCVWKAEQKALKKMAADVELRAFFEELGQVVRGRVRALPRDSATADF